MNISRRRLIAGAGPAILIFVMCLTVYTKLMAKWGYGTPPALAPVVEQADLIVVHKHDRSLILMRSGEIIASYSISLGSGADDGPKYREGDKRTPQGWYVIDSRNAHSRFDLSLHISYPDKNDIQSAGNAGYPAGADIMLHGVPNGWGWLGTLFKKIDWTDGCIAVTNDEIREIWRRVPVGTLIDIER